MAKSGFEAALYLDVLGVDQGVWLEADIADDISPSDADNKIEVKDRRSPAKSYIHGRDDLAYEVTVTKETKDPAYIALRNARINKTIIGVAVVDGDIATDDVEGWYYDANVTQMEPTYDIDGVQAMKFMLVPASGAGVQTPDYRITDNTP